MIGRVAPRLGLVVLAVAAAASLAYDLRALSLDAQGRAEARVASSAPQVDRALSLFAQAARGNADPTPRIDQAEFLLSLGRTRQAAEVLGLVVRTNPGNVQAWSLLSSATAASDPRRSAEANEQLRVLFGHPAGYSTERRSILTPTGVVQVVPGRVVGSVEDVHVFGNIVQFAGWSAAAPGGDSLLVPADQILIMLDGRLVASGAPTVARPDVSRLYGSPTARVGFMINVPVALFQRAGRNVKIQVFGSSQSIASRLPVDCSPRPQPFGCGE